MKEAEIRVLKRAYETAGLRGYWKEQLRRIETRKPQTVEPYLISQLHAALNEKDTAFTWLEKAFEERSAWLPWIKVDPQMDPLRSDPRFKAFLHRMNLDQ